ncbi:MAG: TIGR00180 family glycosyltransferase [Xanthobacteraceae bacterium]
MTKQITQRGGKLAPRLTIVLPLKGRHLFTLRYLWYANEARLPYRFIIADGQVNEVMARHLENSREAFPHLDIDYVRYPDDANYSRFFAKMTVAMSRVRTPYAMLGDNDDFLGVDGIEQALDFLEANADYVCACGRVAGFMVYSKFGNPKGAVHGRLNHLYMASNPNDAAAPMAADRLRQGGIYPLMYYAVYRTAALAAIWREARQIDFSDLVLHENFHALRTLTLGKVRTNRATITHFAQILTSLNTQASQDWVHHLLRSCYTSEVHAIAERLSVAVASADGVEAAPVAEDVRGMFERSLRDVLLTNFGLLTEIKRRIRAKWPLLERHYQHRWRISIDRKKTALLAQLAHEGAAPERVERIRQELAAIETAISPQAFAAFAAPFHQMAQADAARNWF